MPAFVCSIIPINLLHTMRIIFRLVVLSLVLLGSSSLLFASGQSNSDWASAIITVKKAVGSKLEKSGIPMDSLNVDKEMRELQEQFLPQMGAAMPYIGNNAVKFLTSMDGAFEEDMVRRISRSLKNSAFLDSETEKLGKEPDPEQKIRGLLNLFMIVHDIRKMEEQLEWINLTAIVSAISDMKSDPSFDIDTANQKLEELRKLLKEGFSGIYSYNTEAVNSAKRAIQLKREILLSNPVHGFDRILVSRYRIGANARMVNPSAMGTQPNNWSNQSSARRSGFRAEIAEMTGLGGEIQYRTVFRPEGSSSLPDLKLHWDASRFLFSMTDETSRWQVYEVGVDGKGLRKVVDSPEPDLEFFDATYLPDNRVIAVSNIGYHGVPCVSGSDAVGNMVVYNPKDGNMRRLTFDQDANWHPTVMNNGRVMYVRWEYTDLTHYFSRMVMHMNPDGTEQRMLYGTGSVFPNSIFDVQPIPNHPSKFVGVISGHHGVVRSGRLILFDPAMNRKEEKGMVQELPFSKRPIIPIVKDDLVGGVYPQFVKPYPLNDKYFLVTAKLNPQGLWGLYLIDVYDNLTLIAEQEGEGFIHGIPLRERAVPPVIPEKVRHGSKEATVFIQDIYEGEGLPGVPRGTVKSLRVFAYEYAYKRSPSDHVAQGIQSGWDIKRLLGVVPVEADGSAMFTIPANTPVSLQPLDSDGMAIQWMRSWLTGMPGEIVSCVGCHEDQNQIPKPIRAMASVKPAVKLSPPRGGIRPFTFELEIQPILDRACVSCHNGPLSRNYVGGRTDNNVPGNRGYSKSYLDLHPYIHRQGPEAGMKVLYPYEYHASVSPLVQMLKKGHHGVELTGEEWQTLYTWIDFNAPYHSTFKAEPYKVFNQMEKQPYDQYSRRIELMDKYAGGMSVDWKAELKAYIGYLNSQPKPEPVKPALKSGKAKEVRVKGFPFDPTAARRMIGSDSQPRKVEIAPGIFLEFVKIPAGRFIMGTNQNPSDYSPAHEAEVEKAFWMARTEITNEQFRVIFPGHDSRFHDQQWKDHVNEGYPANKPEQPVIRVSWNEAMEYCRKLSEVTGLKIALPSEKQWEWACRAGSGKPFWFGGLQDDFAPYENMADRQMNFMAVSGVDPKPMGENNAWYKYYTWHPKEERVDDGNMLAVSPGQYKANPWGLHDMHGNVSEWTRSDYVSYPVSENQQAAGLQKSVRGGSWKDHPKTAASFYRRAYLPWQKVHNVGFRIIIEE